MSWTSRREWGIPGHSHEQRLCLQAQPSVVPNSVVSAIIPRPRSMYSPSLLSEFGTCSVLTGLSLASSRASLSRLRAAVRRKSSARGRHHSQPVLHRTLGRWEHKEGQEANSLQLTNESFSIISGPQPVAPGEEGIGVSLLNPRQVL